jgi:beta-N-acetylhexosaminidase
MSVERLAAACLLPSFDGLVAPEWVLRRLEDGLGGVVLFADNVADPEQLAALTLQLRDAGAGLIAIDEEGGDVTRLEAAQGSSYPGNLALGVVDDPSLTADVAAAIAADLARVGVNLNFAPVADVNTNPLNPVIGVRSFGSDPELVARHVAAFVEGTQRQGVAACAKHFPGHGDTTVDSHADLPVVRGDLEAALLPFRAAVAAGVRTVMTAHLVVPELDDAPATVSSRILTGLLREELGFDGLVVTDALEMRGLSASVGVEEGAVRALAAGADALCVGHDLREESVAAVVASIAAAVGNGRLPLERLEQAAERVAACSEWAAAPTAEGAPPRTIGAEAARRAVRVDAPPLEGAPFVVELVPAANVAAGEHAHGLAALWPGATGIRVAEEDGAVSLPEDRPLVLVVRDAVRHEWERELVRRHPQAFVIETGIPGGVAAAIETYGAGRINLEAAVVALQGVEVSTY